jgi:hypothetical protein
MGNAWQQVFGPSSPPSGAFAAATTDAAGHWHNAALPPAVQGTEAVSCPSIGTCFALAWTTTVVLLKYRA